MATAEGTEKDEKTIHARFDCLRLSGEWFRPEHELIDYIFPTPSVITINSSFPIDLDFELEKVEIETIKKAMVAANGKIKKTAELLKLSFRQLRHRIGKYRI